MSEEKNLNGAATEQEMRDSKAPWPKTAEELTAYIATLVDRQHDYGTCVYAMSLASVAALNYVAGQLGVSGFQASCADLDILRRTRSMEGPFMIIKVEDELYPQYNLREKVDEFIVSQREWLREQAKAKLAKTRSGNPRVIAHWEALAK